MPESRENVFTRRIGPLPMWLWVVIVVVPLLVWSLVKQRKTGKTTGTPTTGTTSASQVPQFVGQTYLNITPPAAPVMTGGGNPAPTGTGTVSVQPVPGNTGRPAPAGQAPPGPSNLNGQSLSQAIQAITGMGWRVNSINLNGIAGVRNNQMINPANASQYGNYKVIGFTPHTQGQSGQYFANSVDLVIA